MKKLEYRMYGITPYNISDIQKGIQFGHAVQEFNNKILESNDSELIKAFDKWRIHDKTFMVMNGGTTNDDITDKFYGQINRSVNLLEQNDIFHAVFREPDLGNQITAVVFLVDERCFKKKPYSWEDESAIVYPDYEGEFGLDNIFDTYEEWVKSIGGKKNVILRNFISGLRFA